jgi:hypothetical protein
MARGGKPGLTPNHDRALFEALLAEAALRNPDVRRGSMFGSPALFLGRRMIGCVFGPNIGLKVPAEVASQAIARGAATPFRPYGKAAMREWIEIAGPALPRHLNLIEQAIAFAGKDKSDD